MQFETALTSLRSGGRVRRGAWPEGTWIQRFEAPPHPPEILLHRGPDRVPYTANASDLFADDWEIIE